MKVIDADALYDIVMDSIKTTNEAIILQDFIALVEDAPTVDAVEVVRCKDCKHYGTSISGVECQGYCKKTEYITKKDNDFCSWGERK